MSISGRLQVLLALQKEQRCNTLLDLFFARALASC
jgi:hypothetical protein